MSPAAKLQQPVEKKEKKLVKGENYLKLAEKRYLGTWVSRFYAIQNQVVPILIKFVVALRTGCWGPGTSQGSSNIRINKLAAG